MTNSIARLAKLPPIAYERVREREAERLGCRPLILDKAVRGRQAELANRAQASGKALCLAHVEPWPERVVLADALADLHSAIRRHLVLSDHAAVAISLWVAHTYVYAHFENTPRLSINSPTLRCGKSTLVEILATVCNRPLRADSISAAGTFRIVEALAPVTLLLDEVDTFLKENEEIRGVLNSGFARGGGVIRIVEQGGEFTPVRFRTFAPLALAGIGRLPATVEDRAVPIRLQRKRRDDHIERLRDDGNTKRLRDISRRFARWSEDAGGELATSPAIPPEFGDREGDLSVPLLAIGDAAGGDWPSSIRHALGALFGARAASEEGDGAAELLLRHIREIFVEVSATRISSAELCERLAGRDDAPWAEWRGGHPITAHQLAVVLKPFAIRPRTLRTPGGMPQKGYTRESFGEAWQRYSDTNPSPTDEAKV